jgi:hypothetical protein
MANHEVQLQVAHPIQIGNVDVELPVTKDRRLLGKLQVSQGGVNWIPSRSRTKYVLSWAKLGELFKEHGDPVQKG